MNRIESIFRKLAESRTTDPASGRALMPYVTVGDPDLPTTGKILSALQRGGASICELGFPFSDPIADGPVIESSMHYALSRNLQIEQIFEMVEERRSQLDIGLVAMVSYSIVHRWGDQAFIDRAARAGIDGFIIPDAPIEESITLAKRVQDAGLIISMLISPNTPIERAQEIAKLSSGFVYLMSRAGITGESTDLPPELPERISALRKVTDLPIAVGFGISSAKQVRTVVDVADAAIVGSALVRRVSENRANGSDAVVQAAEDFTAQLATGLRP
ncbi:Tryptophan synthase alpha chain [Poriferisphaera corsica]|uniref:Tryptophan synthase alpha chain n=1 Tax=Poriferisphaera corsica TaxID=2528020 RepID=A0A517YV72_9BACT|nr:tryptophan synthase subunit alpha [Poriferisphaera corsica]QDU34139.1 Tryptophan synthase alpha chain [Poriferisphaera corsica]